jgi:class 3 adenylate cyclase/tetratricopeptide (TPR) repeat protein
MFCDLVGSTALSARLDPEDLRGLIGAYRHGVADAVARFEGFVVRYMGDGILVFFGYPQAHEDNAERAVRAGLAAVAAVERLSTSARMPLQARTSIATGVVVVGGQIGRGETHEIDVTGETPNLAAKLQSAAKPGDVVIAASTRRLLGRMFDCHARGPLEVKGLVEPVEVWQVRGELAGISRFEALHFTSLTPLVGRQEEIELLLRRWHQVKLGEGRVVLLAGEPGIGKSRIAETLLFELGGQPPVRLRYFCSPHHIHSVLYPFIAQLERAAEFGPGDEAAARLNKLERLLKPTAKNATQDISLIAELLGLPLDARYPAVEGSPQQKRQMTLIALLNQLESFAAQSPVLIVFEDAHWIDPTSLDLLDRTIDAIIELPVLLVITLRPEFQPTWVGQPHVTMLPLNPLGRRDVTNMITGVTKGKALPEAVIEQILARTDGVPLFVEELTSTLLESGLLRETPDRYVLEAPLPPLAIPATLQASLLARLDRLATVKDVAQIGAAIGREFSRELIAAVSGLAPRDLDAALERLTASGLISRHGSSSEASYSFKHALVLDAAYDSLLKSRRQQLHARIAKVLVERFPTMVENLPELVARHLTEAGLTSAAIGYWRKAGQLASRRSANLEAVKFFDQAVDLLALLPEGPSTLEQAFDIRLELRPALVQLSEIRRALKRLREAEHIAERLNEDHRRGLVYALTTNVHSLLGHLDEACASGTRALTLARQLEDLELRIPATTYLEHPHFLRGEYVRVIELATENLAALPPDRAQEYFGLTAPPSVYDRLWLVMSLAQLGRFAEAAQYEVEASRFAKPAQHAFTAGLAHWAKSTLHLLKGEWPKARLAIEPRAVTSSAWVLAQLGEATEALRRLSEAEEVVDREAEMGIVQFTGWAYQALGRAALLLGRFEHAQRLGDRAVKLSQHQHGFAAHALHLLGDIASDCNQFDAKSATAHYRKALALAEPRGMRPLVAHCHLGLGNLCRRTGERERAREHLNVTTTMYRDMGMRFWLEKAEAEMGQLG